MYSKLNGTVNLAGSKAASADVGFSYAAVVFDSYGLDISVPFSPGMSVGVRNSVSRSLSFTANLTFPGHMPHLLYSKIYASVFDAKKIITHYKLDMQAFFRLIFMV